MFRVGIILLILQIGLHWLGRGFSEQELYLPAAIVFGLAVVVGVAAVASFTFALFDRKED